MLRRWLTGAPLIRRTLSVEGRMDKIVISDSGRIGEVAPECISRGFGIEMVGFCRPGLAEDNPDGYLDQIEHHRKAVAEIEPKVIHGVYADLCPSSWDPAIRATTMKRYRQSCDVARELAATHVVFHSTHIPGVHFSVATWVKKNSRFYQEVLEYAPGNIVFHIENHIDQKPDVLSALVSAIDSSRVDLNLDIGHAHCFSEKTVLEWIESLGKKIGYVHMHDNHGPNSNGHADEHLGLGRGNIPLKEVCHALEELAPRAIWCVETGEWQVSVEWLEENGFL